MDVGTVAEAKLLLLSGNLLYGQLPSVVMRGGLSGEDVEFFLTQHEGRHETTDLVILLNALKEGVLDHAAQQRIHEACGQPAWMLEHLTNTEYVKGFLNAPKTMKTKGTKESRNEKSRGSLGCAVKNQGLAWAEVKRHWGTYALRVEMATRPDVPADIVAELVKNISRRGNKTVVTNIAAGNKDPVALGHIVDALGEPDFHRFEVWASLKRNRAAQQLGLLERGLKSMMAMPRQQTYTGLVAAEAEPEQVYSISSGNSGHWSVVTGDILRCISEFAPTSIHVGPAGQERVYKRSE